MIKLSLAPHLVLKDGLWTRFTAQNKKYAVWIELKELYESSELSAALHLLADKIQIAKDKFK